MKLHMTKNGEFRRCVASECCPYGGAVARTLSRRGDAPLSPAEQDLPIATSGKTSRGGAARSPAEILENMPQPEEHIRAYPQREHRPKLIPRPGERRNTQSKKKPPSNSKKQTDTKPENPVPEQEKQTPPPPPPEAAEVFGVDEERWKNAIPEVKAKRIQEALGTIRTLLKGHDRTEADDNNMVVTVVNDKITVEARKKNGRTVLAIGRLFLRRASMTQVFWAVVQTYGKTAFKNDTKTWKKSMKSAGVPTDFVYLKDPRREYKYLAHCQTCFNWRFKKDRRRIYCARCLMTWNTKRPMKIELNKFYSGYLTEAEQKRVVRDEKRRAKNREKQNSSQDEERVA